MQRGDDEEAWRSIVDNYGDRAELDDEPTSAPVAPPQPPLRTPSPAAYDDDPDRFIPPDPPLPPRPPRDRMLAWAGLFGSPLLLLVLLVAGVRIPSLLAYLMVAGFVGGFLYLVLRLPRSPEDPWDDGARL